MVSILPSARTGMDVLGEYLGKGMTNAMPQMYENQRRQMSKEALEHAFSQVNPDEDFMTQLRKIAPTMLTTPGGAQALSELAPLLGKRAQNTAFQKFYENEKAGQQTSQQIPTPAFQEPAQAQKAIAPSEEEYFRNPDAYASPESLYPEMPAGPQEQPEMSAAEQRMKALDLMNQSMEMGKPLSFPEAQNVISNQNALIQKQNERIRDSKEAQKGTNAALAANMVNRAKNANLIKDPEDSTVAEKLALQSKRMEDPNKQWEFVRSGLRKFDDNKQKIKRSADIAGPFANIYRKGKGTYQDKESLIRGAQPGIDAYKKYGLYDELRADLADSMGLGPDDIETAIFPPTKDERKELDTFPKNQIKLNHEGEEPLVMRDQPFPGQEFRVQGNQYDALKGGIRSYLKNNKKANLVTMRGRLNQEKRYAWQDIQKAVGELVEEGDFIPDTIQEQQLTIMNSPPAPGLFERFKYFWKGTK